jgi:ABC-2 type transport system ATP-binding protein
MSTPVLEAIDVRKKYGSTIALNGVSLAVDEGELFGLLGPNGAGKTTLISILCGLSEADAGEVRLFGKRFRRADRDLRRLIGIGTQDLSIYPDLTARENLRFFGKLYGLGGIDLNSRIEELLSAVGLEDRAGDRAGTFSGGMKRRLNLAASVVHQPRILVLDEPTTGVDPQSRNRIFEQVKALNASGMTIIYTSHYMEEVQELCRRLAILDSGKVLACDCMDGLMKLLVTTIRIGISNPTEGFNETLARESGIERVRVLPLSNPEGTTWLEVVVENVGPALARIASVCAVQGVDLRVATANEPSLERVFLHLTGRALRD